MKPFSLKYKLVALGLTMAFTFQTMESINSHTYTTGVDSYHYYNGCFGSIPTHFAVHCNAENCSRFL